MMNYETFKEQVVEMVTAAVAERVEGYRLHVAPVAVINRVLDGMSFLKNVSDGAATSIEPTVYIDYLYEEYKQCGSLFVVVNNLMDDILNIIQKDFSTADALDFSSVEDSIIFQLINTELNKDLLLDCPHREYLDLSLIYLLKADEGVFLIRNHLSESMGFTEERLHELAFVNTKKLLPPVVMSMLEMGFGDGLEEISQMLHRIPEEEMMYCVTSVKKIFGAVSLYYTDVLQELAERIDSNLYIMPSSVHDLMVVSDKHSDLEALRVNVAEINADFENSLPEDFLSNEVYHYDRVTKKVTHAVNCNSMNCTL